MAKKQGKTSFLGCLFPFYFLGGVFHVVSLCSGFVFMYLLLCECVIHPCFLSFVAFFLLWWLCFIVSFQLCFYYVLLLIILFALPAFSLCVTKSQIKSQKAQISEILFLMFCFGACILALSLGPQNGDLFAFVLLLFALHNVLKYQFLQCF